MIFTRISFDIIQIAFYYTMVFHWSLSDRKSHVFRTLLGILADLDNAVFWMVSTRVLISNSSSPGTNPLVTVSNAPITGDITVTFMFHSFFSYQATSRHSSLFSPSFNFPPWSAGMTKFTIWQVIWFLLIVTRSGRLAEIRWSILYQNPRDFYTSRSQGWVPGCAWSNFNFLHSSFPAQPCLLLYSLCTNLLDLLIMYYYYYHYYYHLCEFFIDFYWSLGDSKFRRVSRTFLSIQAHINNSVVWMASIRSLVSISSSPFSKPLGTFSSASITITPSLSFFIVFFFSVLWQDPSIFYPFVFYYFLSEVRWDG